ncbi:MBL fold metallo-hydrolase [bacterium]|nr:MBL fold metallo-hydrolase [bacterium]
MNKIFEAKSVDGEEFVLYQLRLLEDNFCYILAQNGVCVCVDPGESDIVRSFVEEQGLELEAILLTHFHTDHVAGSTELKGESKVPIVGPKHKELAFLDQEVMEGDELSLGPFAMEIIHAPGHTMEHLMYYFPELKLLFCGDVLFLGGCGKMFEGNEHHYFHSFEKMKKLPGDTILLVGHDYNKKNIDFLQHLTPSFSEKDMAETDTHHTLKKELAINPFLASKSPTAFLELYQARDAFRSGLRPEDPPKGNNPLETPR